VIRPTLGVGIAEPTEPLAAALHPWYPHEVTAHCQYVADNWLSLVFNKGWIMEVADIVQVRIYCTMGNQTAVNVRHYAVTAKAGVGATPLEFAAQISAAVAGPYKGLMSSLADFHGVDAQVVWPIPGLAEGTIANAGPGTITGDPLPFQTCGLIALRTATPTRHGRGRVYIPFPAETDNSNTGVPSAGYVTALDLIGTQLFLPRTPGTGGNTNTLTPVIYNRVAHTALGVTQWISRLYWATQRRRGNFGRPNAPPF